MERNRPIRKMLVIDDAPIDREIYSRFLAKDPYYDYEVLEAETGEEGLKLLRDYPVDCLLLDYNLPDLDGLDVLDKFLESGADEVPVVMLTGAGSEAVAVETMKRGCQDYVVKSEASEAGLLRAVDNAIEQVRIRHEMEAKRREDELSQRNQIELRNRFLSHVSHELRTPLTAVHQFISLCLDGVAGEVTDQQREFLEIAERNADQLKNMIGDLMEVTRAESGKLRVEVGPVPVGELVIEAVRTMEASAQEKQIALRSRVEGEMPKALGDSSRIRQILANLIENAIKFTPEGGRIDVRARLTDDPNPVVEVSVSDTGCGISESGCRQVFDRLHQEPEGEDGTRKGLGLGLAICKELIDLQGGQIWVESEQGRGSEFIFTLPVASLAQLIGRALMCEGTLRSEFGLIRVRFGGGGPGGYQANGEGMSASARRRVHHLISRLVYYDHDVVLPQLWDAAHPEYHYVVAATDAVGLEAMSSRIRSHLASNLETVAPGYEVEVDARLEGMPTLPEGAPEAPEDARSGAILERAAATVEARIADPAAWAG